ncbi:MAG TPA: hypothetical protein VHT51_07545, partial [Micropepsaceae bacterium]|nr:hypothetical protein [Micropepsaceae bacterium]
PRTAQRLFPRSRDPNRIGALIGFRTLTIQQSLFNHPADHFRKRGTIDAGNRNEIRLTHAFVLLDGGKNRVLLLGQIA